MSINPETNIGQLAVNIYDNEIAYDAPSGALRDTEVKLISGWLQGHLGELNTRIFTSFSGENPEGFNLEEQAILREMYMSEYYRRKQRIELDSMSTSSIDAADWVMIQEGDSVIKKQTKQSSTSFLRVYQENFKMSMERIDELVYAYNLYGANPKQVAGKDAPRDNS